MDQIKILGFAGSLRKGSYNKLLLKAAAELCPKDAVVEIYDLDNIPLYNQDLESDFPEVVKDFKARIRAANAILIATPEYNFSFPGVLKNAIDFASRPYGDNAFDGKPAAIMGATLGNLGTARAQYHLRQVCVFVNLLLLNRPEVLVGAAHEKFDEAGRLTDEETREWVRQLMEALVDWARKLKSV